MLEQSYIQESLAKIICYRCGANLGGASLVPITQAPVALVAHASCGKCKAQSMVTVTPSGVGAVPLVSDLTASEIKKFVNLEHITYEDVVEVHKLLEENSIWKLLHKKEKSLERKQKVLEKTDKYQE